VDEKRQFYSHRAIELLPELRFGVGTVSLKGKGVGIAGRQHVLLGREKMAASGENLKWGPGTGCATELARNDRKGERLKETLRIT